MTIQVTATEAKATLPALLDRAAAGDEIEITKHGRPAARLVPAVGARSLKGSFADVGMATVTDDQLFTPGARWNVS